MWLALKTLAKSRLALKEICQFVACNEDTCQIKTCFEEDLSICGWFDRRFTAFCMFHAYALFWRRRDFSFSLFSALGSRKMCRREMTCFLKLAHVTHK